MVDLPDHALDSSPQLEPLAIPLAIVRPSPITGRTTPVATSIRRGPPQDPLRGKASDSTRDTLKAFGLAHPPFTKEIEDPALWLPLLGPEMCRDSPRGGFRFLSPVMRSSV